MGSHEYKEQKNAEAESQIKKLLADLPDFCRTYNTARSGSALPLTRLAYMQRYKTFFEFLHQDNSYFAGKSIKEITCDDLDHLETEDIEEFTSWIRLGNANTISSKTRDKAASVNNYISALNSLWRFLLARRRVTKNPVSFVERDKTLKHDVIRLNQNDELGFFDSLRAGTDLTRHQEAYRTDVTVARDDAICMTLIRTGIRVSELVGLNLTDIDFQTKSFKIIRKRSKEDTVYFSDAVEEALQDYLDLRPELNPDPDEQAVFLVTIGKYRGKRLSVRSVENLVKKYAKSGAPMVGSTITPHKLRASYATNMINETGNLALVQTLLNHSSPSTTSLYIDDRSLDKQKHRNDLD